MEALPRIISNDDVISHHKKETKIGNEILNKNINEKIHLFFQQNNLAIMKT